MGIRGSFPEGSDKGVKLTTPFSAEVKNGGVIPPLPHILHGEVVNY
jgi:hypothetical protein